jgi:nicotinamide-nucleotide amidase
LNTAAIISIGTELTEGRVLDLHSRFLSSHLRLEGVSTLWHTTIPDDLKLIKEQITLFLERVDFLFLTGGLGPTSDDLTREALAEAAGLKLLFNADAWRTIQERFKGRRLSEPNQKQAYIPEGFTIIENRGGTAPGFMGKIRSTTVVALPGPPREMRPMFSEQVLPLVRPEFSGSATGNITGSLFMVSESYLEETLQSLAARSIEWGTQIDEDRILLTLAGGDERQRTVFFDGIRERLGEYRVRRGDVHPSDVLVSILEQRAKTVAVAESCTGGLLSKMLTDRSGSSAVFRGGCVAYSNEAKVQVLAVDPTQIEVKGAVSEEVVRAMAVGAARVFGSDFGIGVSGVAGPTGGTPEKPVGTVWISVSEGHKDVRSLRFQFSGSRQTVRRKTALAGILMLEMFILNPNRLDIVQIW